MPESDGIELPVETHDVRLERPMALDAQIEAQMGMDFAKSSRRLDDIAERFQASTAFTEARANQHYESASLSFMAELQNAIEQNGLANLALQKKVAENANPSTQGT